MFSWSQGHSSSLTPTLGNHMFMELAWCTGPLSCQTKFGFLNSNEIKVKSPNIQRQNIQFVTLCGCESHTTFGHVVCIDLSLHFNKGRNRTFWLFLDIYMPCIKVMVVFYFNLVFFNNIGLNLILKHLTLRHAHTNNTTSRSVYNLQNLADVFNKSYFSCVCY